MQPVRKYPWNDFTINDWLAVDADNHVCFVESYREKFAPHWISIPSHYLANLHVRLEHACSYTAPLQTKQILTDQEIADILGIFFLSSPNDGGNDVPYVYEAVPAVPRTVHELPEPFSAIAENVRLPRKRLVAKEEIRCHDWIQGNITELDTLSMDNGLLVEKQDSADLVWLPSDFRRTRCEVMHVRFLPNAKLQKEITTTFPTYVDWGRYKALFQDLIQCYCHLLAAESVTVRVDSDGLPNRTSLFYTHGIPVGCYTFGPPGDDSFLLDHGEIDLWLVAKKLPRAAWRTIQSLHGSGNRDLRHGNRVR